MGAAAGRWNSAPEWGLSPIWAPPAGCREPTRCRSAALAPTSVSGSLTNLGVVSSATGPGPTVAAGGSVTNGSARRNRRHRRRARTLAGGGRPSPAQVHARRNRERRARDCDRDVGRFGWQRCDAPPRTAPSRPWPHPPRPRRMPRATDLWPCRSRPPSSPRRPTAWGSAATGAEGSAHLGSCPSTCARRWSRLRAPHSAGTPYPPFWRTPPLYLFPTVSEGTPPITRRDA